jgi:uncharacterized protein YggE
MITDPNSLNRQQIKAAFRRHHGAATQLARDLGITPQNVYDFLNGRGRSKRVEVAAKNRAAELISAERDTKPATAA